MKIKVLASGSKGNCTYIESNNTKLLIDVGINQNKLSGYFEKESYETLIFMAQLLRGNVEGLKEFKEQLK